MLTTIKQLFAQAIRLLKMERKQLPIFFFLIGLSSIFWVLTVLSKDYTSTIEAPVVFVDFPEDKLLVESQELSLQMQVNAPGFALLAYQFRFFDKIALSVNGFISKRKGKDWEYFWLGEQSLAEVQANLPHEMQLLHIQPNRIALTLSDKSQKTVPIQIKSYLSFESMFRQKEPIRLEPDHIVVTGPKTVVESVEFVSTEPLRLNGIKSKQEGLLKLAAPQHPELSFSQETIDWSLQTEAFTEGVQTIPLQLKGVPKGYELKLFPEEVELHYLVSLANFDKVTANMFRAQVHFSETRKRLPVKLNKQSNLVENIRISPAKVEYILIKK